MARKVPQISSGSSVPDAVSSPATASRVGAPRSKYRAIPVEIDGIRFASQAEGRRYCQLKLLERAGEISRLELQPRYDITINGVKVCTYVGDFRYMTKDRVVTEDVKGVRTPIFRLKKKLVESLYPGVKIVEVK
jgi:hypothetical protein